MDPKVKPPTRIVVSGGPKVEPHLHMAHENKPGIEWAKLIMQATAIVIAGWLLLSLFLLLGTPK